MSSAAARCTGLRADGPMATPGIPDASDPSGRRRYVVIGAGAGGIACAKLLALSESGDVLLCESHSEPGGCAGYFSRGGPRRSFDAGATQLVACGPGQLQRTLLLMGKSPEDQRAAALMFEPIPSLTQHWIDRGLRVELKATGHARLAAGSLRAGEDLLALERFLAKAHAEAGWMWTLLNSIPRFPLQGLGDVIRAARLGLSVPIRRWLALPFLFTASVATMTRRSGVSERNAVAQDIISGLLIDTVQTSPRDAPWLAGCMGLSILSHGIVRVRGGMRTFFRSMLSDVKAAGGTYRPRSRLVRLETVEAGFKLTLVRVRQSNGKESGGTNSEAKAEAEFETILCTDGLALNLTLWDVTGDLVPAGDPLRRHPVFRAWERRAHRERGWGAFALYGTLECAPDQPDGPWFHQIFPRAQDPSDTRTSLYVSVAGKDDPSNPSGARVFTATIHVDADDWTPERRAACEGALRSRLEAALGARVNHLETATPETFARFTGRARGQVGGLVLRLRNFLVFAPPSRLAHPNGRTELCLVGDTVFPGQGIIACSVSGIIAWERLTGRAFAAFTRATRGRHDSHA